MRFNWTFTAKLENGLNYKAENVSLYGVTVNITANIRASTAYPEIYFSIDNSVTTRPDYSLGIGLFL